MDKVNIILVGFGRVGRAFFELIKEKYDDCLQRYGLQVELRGIARQKGIVLLSSTQKVLSPSYFAEDDLDNLADWIKAITISDLLDEFREGVLVDCTPSNLISGEPGLSLFRLALDKGWHVVTASKGALALWPDELKELAKKKGLNIKASAAAAAALPTLDVGRRALAGSEIMAIEGILNGTTNYILTRMAEGLDFDEALKEAQEKGIAEPEPSMDIDGWDTAAKMVIIANEVLGTEIKLSEVQVRGIRGIKKEIAEKASSLNKILKLFGKCYREKASSPWKIEVGLALLDPVHPLARTSGTSKGIIFYTDTMGWVAVTGGQSSPKGAAAALLKDIISIYRP
ncbi:MAG TPA: homoserine dehydrogenase [Candidatus Saccharicenans sp.]|jgi:homoserine dehydrogenase|nr:homoserine dehydrogenase [Candidatus Saccharicenans sp.]HRD01170.1 homoserine dehydrogenase [Candidatus Saccharicenans sp.]